MANISPKSIYHDLETIRQSAPLIHNITNFVVMNQTANVLLALGASPIMAHAKEELADLLTIANALVINIGTLDAEWISSMKNALTIAAERKMPIVLDPVGAGASTLRTDTCHALLTIHAPTVIRANASEILALAKVAQQTKGVESRATSDDAKESASQLAKQYHNVVTVSGATDWCLDDANAIAIHNGTPLMARVTGMGCSATAVVAAFCAVNPNYWQASAHAMAVMGIAGEIAAEQSAGPGSFQWQFLDALANLNESMLASKLQISA